MEFENGVLADPVTYFNETKIPEHGLLLTGVNYSLLETLFFFCIIIYDNDLSVELKVYSTKIYI